MGRGADDDNDNDDFDGQDGADGEMDVVNQEKNVLIDRDGDGDKFVESQDEDVEEDMESSTKNLRASYRLLEQNTDGARHDIRSLEPSTLSRSLLKAQSLMKKVQRVPEAKIDARLVGLIANLGAQKARELKINSGSFSIDLFLTKLKTLMSDGMDDGRAQSQTQSNRRSFGPSQRRAPRGTDHDRETPSNVENDENEERECNWGRIGKMIALGGYTKRAPSMDFMLGPLSIEVRQRAATVRAPLDRSKASQVQVHQVQENEVERSVNETSHNVRVISKLLHAACSGPQAIDGKVPLVKFFLNPASFSQTVENLFYLSFLIKDGLACIDQGEEDDSGELYVFACQSPDDDDYANGLVRKQLVFDLTIGMWQDLIKLYDITSSMIPTRPPVVTGSAKWYG